MVAFTPRSLCCFMLCCTDMRRDVSLYGVVRRDVAAVHRGLVQQRAELLRLARTAAQTGVSWPRQRRQEHVAAHADGGPYRSTAADIHPL